MKRLSEAKELKKIYVEGRTFPRGFWERLKELFKARMKVFYFTLEQQKADGDFILIKHMKGVDSLIVTGFPTETFQ